MKTTKQIRGNLGEQIARNYLKNLGLKFIASNWSCKLGEVDLIMHDPKENSHVFVEVRLRAPTNFGEGFDTVHIQKQKKLINTARYYQQSEDYWDDLRFDVVSIIDIPGQKPEVNHIPNAFTL